MYTKTMSIVPAKHRTKAVEVFHALGDATRLEILDCLRGGERCVCELTDALKTGQSRLSFHLKVLKEVGLVIDRPEGRWIYYSLNQTAIQELEEVVDWLKETSAGSRSRPYCP
jgi:ArsR family transcriptional regulator, arsenate/arsenite/antimonite-responsive transcriptional repressor